MLLAWLLAFSGLAALSLAMERHYRKLWRPSISRRNRTALRITGACLVIGSLLRSVIDNGGSVGTVGWLGCLSLAGFLLILLLTYAPYLVHWLALAAACAAGLLLVMG